MRDDLQDVEEPEPKKTAALSYAERYPNAVIGAFVNQDRPSAKVTSKIEAWLYDLVTKYSAQFNTSPSAIVRESLKEWMRKQGEKI